MTVSVFVPSPMLDLLRQSGAHTSGHSQRTLMDHLVGTYNILQSWGAPDHVCTAGLFHSIYGTNAFHRQSLGFSERPLVQAAIGGQAEHLAWLFCSVERPQAFLSAIQHGFLTNRCDASMLDCSVEILSELLEIECANLIEQGGRSSALQQIYCEAVSQRDLISAQAYISIKQHLSQAPVRLVNSSTGVLI